MGIQGGGGGKQIVEDPLSQASLSFHSNKKLTFWGDHEQLGLVWHLCHR